VLLSFNHFQFASFCVMVLFSPIRQYQTRASGLDVDFLIACIIAMFPKLK